MPSTLSTCPLCSGVDVHSFVRTEGRVYWRCGTCALIHLDPGARPDPDAERARYETHENDPGDPGYRAFLDRLALPLVERLDPGAEGLDYGSGPGPTLSVMLEERGFPTRIHDPYFAPDRATLGRRYDFITCTETAEHFFRPAEEFARFDRMLRPGGWLGVMTEWVPGSEVAPGSDVAPGSEISPGSESSRDTDISPATFAEWYYRRDPTHVCFYSPDTMRWIAGRHGWDLELPRVNVALFRKARGC